VEAEAEVEVVMVGTITANRDKEGTVIHKKDTNRVTNKEGTTHKEDTNHKDTHRKEITRKEDTHHKEDTHKEDTAAKEDHTEAHYFYYRRSRSSCRITAHFPLYHLFIHRVVA